MWRQRATWFYVWLTAVTFSLTFAKAIPSCAANTLPDKTLVYCSEASPAGFDIDQYAGSVEASAAAYTVYNRLV